VQGKGDTVRVKRLNVQTATDFTGTATATDVAEVDVDVKLDHQPYVQSKVSAKEREFDVQDFFVQIVNPGVQGVAEYIDNQIGTTLQGTTTPAVTGADPRKAILAAREYMGDSKIPMSERYIACSPTFASEILDADWMSADKRSDGGLAYRAGVIGMAFGFTFVESSYILDVDFDNADADDDPDTGDVEAGAVAFHKSGLVMASRVPAPPRGGAMAAASSAFGISTRVIMDWDNSKLSDVVTVDTLCGFKRTDDVRLVPVYI